MKNKETIEKIEAFVKSHKDSAPNRRELVEFNLQDVKLKDRFEVNDLKLQDKASDVILGLLNAKPTFVEYKSLLEEKDWNFIANLLKNAKGDINLLGRLVRQPDGTHEVANIFFKNPKKKRPDDLTNTDAIISAIIETLASSEIDWSFVGGSFHEEDTELSLTLRNENYPVEVFKGDEWKKGTTLSFNSFKFFNRPYFERLICSNVMVGEQYGWKGWISQTSYTNDKLLKQIQNALSSNNDDVSQMITQYAQHSKKNNISLREFYAYRKFYEKKGYDDILDKYFIEAPFYQAWGENIEGKDDIWKATADSGINAYGFINLNTWLASHLDKSGMTEEDALEMKMAITNLFIKERFDLEGLAPKATVDFPRFKEME